MPFFSDIYYHQFQGGGSILKPPLILIHGAAGSHLHWPPEMRRLPGTRVYALDLPAHGKSSGQARQTIEAYASSVHEWFVGLQLSKAVFAGHSMGGAIAIKLALDYPDCVSGLVLLGAGARMKVSSEILQFAESETTYLSAVKQVVDLSFSPDTPIRLIELAIKRMAETRHSVVFADFRACDAFDVIGRLSEIQIPTLILCGEQDRLTPLRLAINLSEHISDSKLEVIPGAGHMLQIEKPGLVSDAVRDFIYGLSYI